MRSTTPARLALCSNLRNVVATLSPFDVAVTDHHKAVSYALTQLLVELRAIRARLDACSVGNAFVTTGLVD